MSTIVGLPRSFVALASFGIALYLLSWLEPVLIPIAMAILLTFLLSPLVSLLQRRHVPRAVGVVAVVMITFFFLGGVAWLVARQVTSLVDTYPQYEQNLDAKLDVLQSGEGGFIDKLQNMVERISRQLEKRRKAAPETPSAGRATEPLAVTVVQDRSAFQLSKLWSVLGPAMEPFAAVGLTIVLVIFMLIRREDLRDRAISLVGRGHLTLTTKALDEAGERISRYLLTQLAINGSYGAAVALGLFFIGVPYAALWGFFAAVFRYIPYLGAWLAALLPIGLSLLIAQGWTAPLLVVGWFLLLELITNMVIEPMFYGRGIGVSETATLIMVAFWAWLWGPIGLVLATPLTVCLVVLGKYVPALGFFDILLGDAPAIDAPVGYYQRLLARDQDEAASIAEEHLAGHSLVATFDSLLIPALVHGKRDAERHNLTDDEQRFVVAATREVVDDLATLDQKAAHEKTDSEPTITSIANKIRVLACPARDASDETALSMLKAVLDPACYEVQVAGGGLLASDVATQVGEMEPAVVCIAAVPPGGMAQARLLCLRLRNRFPDLKLLIGRWGVIGEIEKMRAQLIAAGADDVGASLGETMSQLATLRTLATHSPRL